MDPYKFVSDSDSDTEFHGFSPRDIHNHDDTLVNDQNDLSDISSISSMDSSDYDMMSPNMKNLQTLRKILPTGQITI